MLKACGQAQGWGADPLDAVVQFVWLRTPIRVARRFQRAAMVLADGHYLSRWPLLALLILPCCVLIGLASGALHEHRTFTYSLVLMASFGVLGQFGASLGLCVTLGFAVGDFFLNDADGGSYLSGVDRAVKIWIPETLSYFLLGLLTVMAPLSVLGFRSFVFRLPGSIARLAEPVAAAAAAALAAWVWTQSVPLLIRPVFVWPGGVPETEAIRPLQQYGWWLVLVLALTTAARVVLENAALTGGAARLSLVLWAGLQSDADPPLLRKAGEGRVIVLFGACGATFLLAGLIESYWTALAVFLFFTGLLFLRRFLALTPPAPVVTFTRIPLLVRICLSAIGAYVVSQAVVSFFWARTQTFLPVLAGVCAAVTIVTLLTIPRMPSRTSGATPRGTGVNPQ